MIERKTKQQRQEENDAIIAEMKIAVAEIEAEGRQAFKDGILLEDNPLPDSHLLKIFWSQGWNQEAGTDTSTFTVDWDNVWLVD